MPIGTSGERIRVSAQQILQNLRQGFLTLGVCVCVCVCVHYQFHTLPVSPCPHIYLSSSPPAFLHPLLARALALPLVCRERTRRRRRRRSVHVCEKARARK